LLGSLVRRATPGIPILTDKRRELTMINLYGTVTPEVKEWIAKEIRGNIEGTSAWLVGKGKDPIKYTEEDIECLVIDFLNGVHEQVTIDMASRFEIEGDLL
jgi:hypothetical protein